MLPLLRHFFVSSVAAASWLALSGCVQEEQRKAPTDLSKLRRMDYEKPISFGAGGEGEHILLTGWATPEPEFTWSNGIAASLGIRLQPTTDVVRLHFKMVGMNLPPRLPSQRVDLYINSERLARWEVANENVLTVTIPEKFVSGPDPLLLVDFYMPKAVAPETLGAGSDRRRLGVRLAELTISRSPRNAGAANDQR